MENTAFASNIQIWVDESEPNGTCYEVLLACGTPVFYLFNGGVLTAKMDFCHFFYIYSLYGVAVWLLEAAGNISY